MKLILTKLEPETAEFCMPLYTSNLFEAYCWYNGISIGHIYRDWEISYNNFYHFYDIHLFPTKGKYPTAHWQKVIDLFNFEGYETRVESTFRWDTVKDEKVMTKGIRIWIYTKDIK